MSIAQAILHFFDRLEDTVRGWFSHYPILYAFVGGIGAVLFWRGVWHTVDYAMLQLSASSPGESSIDLHKVLWWDGPVSLVLGTALLLMIGIFVSSFIGNEIIMTGLRGEKKLTEKTEKELRTEVGAIADIKTEVAAISKQLEFLERDIQDIKKKP